ncbi:hypothetical protein GQ54DRAFT_322979 [Martensiomyces pterosporus]|nr:hypothetical protein GQ54DRAFT_322979 [Martensiomyces pterosporus]
MRLLCWLSLMLGTRLCMLSAHDASIRGCCAKDTCAAALPLCNLTAVACKRWLRKRCVPRDSMSSWSTSSGGAASCVHLTLHLLRAIAAAKECRRCLPQREKQQAHSAHPGWRLQPPPDSLISGHSSFEQLLNPDKGQSAKTAAALAAPGQSPKPSTAHPQTAGGWICQLSMSVQAVDGLRHLPSTRLPGHMLASQPGIPAVPASTGLRGTRTIPAQSTLLSLACLLSSLSSSNAAYSLTDAARLADRQLSPAPLQSHSCIGQKVAAILSRPHCFAQEVRCTASAASQIQNPLGVVHAQLQRRASSWVPVV